MDVVRTHPRSAEAAGGVRRRAPRRAAGTSLLVALVLLLIAAEAQAYRPGQLIYAKRIGTRTSGASAWTIAAGPNGATAIAGWKAVAHKQVPMVARYSAAGKKWVKTYAASGLAEAVAFDRSGNVYVAAVTDPYVGGDIVVIKYSAAGKLLWERQYDGPASLGDYVGGLAIDRAGNVVVVGSSMVTTQLSGIVVLKYKSNGDPAWEPVRFDPDLNDPDAGAIDPEAVALDGANNIYVAGSSLYRVSGVWYQSALTLKFAGRDGVRQWGQSYEARHNTGSDPESIAVQGTTVAVVGQTHGGTSDALIVEYATGSGDEIRWKEWGAGNATSEWFGDVVLDSKGNVFVTGDQWLPAVGGHDKAVTMKLSRTLSKVVWKKTYLPKSRDAEGWYIARDGLGNVYVSGVAENKSGDEDYLTIKYNAAGLRKWLKTWSGGGPGDDEAAGIVLGTKGGVYVGGEATGKGDICQAVLLKYQR